MKAIDTNVLARYLRDDDPKQSARAARLIQQAVNQGELLFVNHVVLCELVWILTSVYGHRKDEIAQTVSAILSSSHFELEDRPGIEAALTDYRNSNADFADCLIGRRNLSLGCDVTMSFDRDLRKIPTFEVF